ncbi:MAG TPA: AraC family transcriptional regulator [Saprospiraceae bacterium]|nr:AraC family transcriptional regulator [Saprospiraceae bacterium]
MLKEPTNTDSQTNNGGLPSDPFYIRTLNFNAASERPVYVVKENEITMFHLISGNIEWIIDDQYFTILPNDLLVVYPKSTISWVESSLDICTIYEIRINVESLFAQNIHKPLWSGIHHAEFKVILNLIKHYNPAIIPECKFPAEIVSKIMKEIANEELGFKTRTYALVDELIISTARCIGKNSARNTDFKEQFLILDKMLRNNLSHQWTVAEMAGIVGFGITSFTDKVKNHSGFSPLNYLISLRITEAIKLIKNTDISMTHIALRTGFYSSQHFSSTFKKVTGLSPKDFRKKD